MAKGKWEVMSNIINGYQRYRVARKLRDNEPLHSGNVLYVGGYTDNKKHAQEEADKFNNYDGKTCPLSNMFLCDNNCPLDKSGVDCPFK